MQWNELKSHLRHLSTKDQERIQKAFELGKDAHKDQKRKSGEPYFTHPIAVTHILADMGADADTLIASLLHDTVEDTDITLKDIDSEFDGSVAELIDGVTKLEPEDIAYNPTLDDQIETLRKMFTMLEDDVRIMVIKLADRLHNMQTIEHLAPERQQSMAKETLDIYVKIADRLCMSDIRDELEGLCLSILEPTLLRKLTNKRQKNEEGGIKAIERIEEQLTTAFEELMKDTELLFEKKSWGKLRGQANLGKNIVSGLSSVTCVFICESVHKCYEMLGALHQFWAREALSFQDYINAPMINGYRGLHTTIILDSGLRIRCKIRTEDMHHYAREGISTLCFDSDAIGLLDYLLPWMGRIAPLSEGTANHSDAFWENLKSDILGDSITIHGANDEHVMLPQHSTALDGVLYLYKSKGLRVKEVYVNGEEVPFHAELPHACSLSASFQRKSTVSLDWLHSVNTGIASAIIREALAKVPEDHKMEHGKGLLRKAVEYQNKFNIDELDEEELGERILKTFGIHKAVDLFINIAEGKINAVDAAELLFPSAKGSTDHASIHSWDVSVSCEKSDKAKICSLMCDHQASQIAMKEAEKGNSLRARMHLSHDDLRLLQTKIRTLAPSASFRMLRLRNKYLQNFALLFLVFLWGMDPVVVHYILKTDISTHDLTFIRFVTFTCCATVFYLIATLKSRKKFKPISPFNPLLIFSAISLFATASLTHLSLLTITADQYILLIIAGLVVASMTEKLPSKKGILSLIGSLILFSCGIVILASYNQLTFASTMYGIGAGLAFALYSILTRRYQANVESIQARYPAFLFWISIIALPFALMLYPYTHGFGYHPIELTIFTTVFVFIFNILPYAIYYECMRRVDKKKLEKSLPYVCLWAFGGAFMQYQSIATLLVLPIAAIAIHFYYRGIEED